MALRHSGYGIRVGMPGSFRLAGRQPLLHSAQEKVGPVRPVRGEHVGFGDHAGSDRFTPLELHPGEVQLQPIGETVPGMMLAHVSALDLCDQDDTTEEVLQDHSGHGTLSSCRVRG